MNDIIVKMKDGTVRQFLHEGYKGKTKDVRTEGVFLVITDEFQKRTMIPAADILEVEVIPK